MYKFIKILRFELVKKNKYLIAILAIAVFVYYRWLSLSSFTFADWWFFFADKLRELSISSVWLADKALGSVDLTFWRLPVYYLYSIFGNFGFNSNVADVFVVFLPIVFLLPLGSYFLIKKIVKSDIGAFVGSIVVSFNTYFLASSTQGHIMINAASAFCIISILFFIKAIEDLRWWKYLILSAASLFASTFYDLRISYITVFILFFYFVYHIFIIKGFRYQFKNTTPLVFCGIFFLSIFTLLNLYWVLPQAISGSLSDNTILGRSLFGNNFWNIQHAFNLFHPFWNGGAISWFAVQQMPFYFWLIPLFAFAGLILDRKNKLVLFFGFVSLLGIFLTKQVGEPFTGVYQWLYDHLPGFNAFREASKFYFLIALGYSVLIGSFINWLWLNWVKNKWQIFGKYALTFFIAGLFLWNTKPIITGEIGTLFVPRHIPNDYLVLKDFVLNQPDYFRTFWTPRDSRWGIYVNDKPKISNVGLISADWKNIFSNNYGLVQDQIINVFDLPYSNSIFDVSSIKYVVVPLQDITNDDDFYIHYGGKENPNVRKWYIDQLDKISFLKKVDIGTKDLVVYENEGYKPPVFTFNNLYTFEFTSNLDQKFNFISKQLNDGFYFSIPFTINATSSTTHIDQLFENIDIKNVSATTSSIIAITTISSTYKNTFYVLGGVTGSISVNGAPVTTGLNSFPDGENKFVYKNPQYTFQNLILNASFEAGSWQKEVGDCHNYDNNPILGMSLNTSEKTDGKQSLQLEATRHNACVSQRVPVKSGATYLLDFDYQSPNAKYATYYLGFNDPNGTDISEDIPVTSDEWVTFSKTIKVPKGATEVSVYIYADAKDGKTNIINRYDNFHLIEVPDLSDAYYLVSDTGIELAEPKEITFDLINPTRKLVHIKGATTPFYLAMSESYHPQWQLQFNNDKINGFFNSWVPFVKSDRIGDGYHYKLNGFLNAWYVNTKDVCSMKALCTKNADGSYDIEIVLEFFPQRWFYLGLLISGTILVSLLGYLGYDFVRRRKQINNEKTN